MLLWELAIVVVFFPEECLKAERVGEESHVVLQDDKHGQTQSTQIKGFTVYCMGI